MRTTDKEMRITRDIIVGHEIEIMVQAVDENGHLQAAEDSPKISIEIQGKTTGPGAGANLVVTPGIAKLYLSWSDPEDIDFDVMEVWRSDDWLFSNATKIGEARADYYLDEIGSSGTIKYYWIRARNTSGITGDYHPATTGNGIQGTTEYMEATEIGDFAVTATKVFNNTIILTGDTWSDNSPAAGRIAWNEHYLVNNGKYFKIDAGNTDTSSKKYVYWDYSWVSGSGTIADPYISSYSTSAGYSVSGLTRFMIAVNESGVTQNVWNASANMVIGTAFILDAAITTAKIDDLQVTGAKIANATINDGKVADLSADKLTAGTIDASVITVSNINASNISTGTLTAITMQTASSGQRIVISQADNTLRFHSATATNAIVIDDNVIGSMPGILMTDATNGTVMRAIKDVNDFGSYGYQSIFVKSTLTGTNKIIELDRAAVGNVFSVDMNGDAYLKRHVDIDGDVDIAGNLDVHSGIDVTGNITVSGTVDTVDIQNHSARHENTGADQIEVTHDIMDQSYSTFSTSFDVHDSSAYYDIVVEDGVITSHTYHS